MRSGHNCAASYWPACRSPLSRIVGSTQAKVVSALIDDQSSTNDRIVANHGRLVGAVIEIASVTHVIVKQGKQVASAASSVRFRPLRAPVLEPMTFIAFEGEIRARSRTILSILLICGDLEGVLKLIGRKVFNRSPNKHTRVETWDTEVYQIYLSIGPMIRVCRIGLEYAVCIGCVFLLCIGK